MRKITLCMHVSVDGFVAGPGGEMDWIKVNDELFDLVGSFTDEADTALYGRNTYQMMDSYWPNAADRPNAGRHDIQHAQWYNRSEKIVVSLSMKDTVKDKTTIISENIATAITQLKNKEGGNIMIFGSPMLVHLLTAHQLIDEYRLFVNPVILGKGIPLFTPHHSRTPLKMVSSQTFASGVTALQYTVVR